jgi:hypothetical protein
MSKLVHKKYPVKKISSMRDLDLMRERYRYEVKLKEQSLKTEFTYFRNDLKSAARQTLNDIIEKMLINVALRLLKK